MTLMEDTGESFIRSMDRPDATGTWSPTGGSRIGRWGCSCPTPRGTPATCGPRPIPRSTATTCSPWTADPAVLLRRRAGGASCRRPPRPTADALTTPCRPAHAQPDLYTHSRSATPRRWTSRRSPRPMDDRGLGQAGTPGPGCQTFVVRDGITLTTREVRPVPPRWPSKSRRRTVLPSLSATWTPRHEAVAAEPALQENHWYHTGRHERRPRPAVLRRRPRRPRLSTPCRRRLARERLDGPGQAATSVCGGSDVEGRPGFPAEWFQGFIDEIRVSDVALAPSQFLFSPERNDEG